MVSKRAIRKMDIKICKSTLRGEIQPPCSKSYAQRALACALLSEGQTTLRGIEFCHDTLSSLGCIKTLGAEIITQGEDSLLIRGGLNPRSNQLMVGESGLATRLFTPIAALCSEPITICGEGTLLRRPMYMMFAPLQSMGVELLDGGGYLPIRVKGPMRGNSVEVDGSISSQFITGLLIALASRHEECSIKVKNPSSIPYIDITIDSLSHFGCELSHSDDYTEFYVPQSDGLKGCDMTIESDWSSAAAWLVGGAIAGSVKVKNLKSLSRQADTAICRALERAGASITIEEESVTVERRELRAFDFDATQSPDLFPVLVALASQAKGTSHIKGVSRLEFKETNRAEVLQEEYARLGIEIDIEDDVMSIRGGKIGSAVCSPHGDHRIAMSLALAGLCCEGGVTITNAECVAKSYPTFFEDLKILQSTNL